MKWEVSGADRATGAEKTIIVEADNEASAGRRAARAGMMVSDVRALDPDDSVAAVTAAPQVRPANRVSVTAVPPPPRVPPSIHFHAPAAAPVSLSATAALHVHRGPRISGLGVASLVFGIIALLFCWIPLVGLLSLPLADIAVLLAVIGQILALAEKKSSIGLPIAGGIVGLIAIGLAVFSTVFASAEIRAAADRAKVANATGGSSSAAAAVVNDWSDVTEKATVGDVSIEIESAAIGRVPLMTVMDQATKSEKPALLLNLNITNTGTHPLQFTSWSAKGGTPTVLLDEVGGVYPVPRFGNDTPTFLKTGYTVAPGTTITDVVAFSEPPVTVSKLRLVLPGKNVGADGEARLIFTMGSP